MELKGEQRRVLPGGINADVNLQSVVHDSILNAIFTVCMVITRYYKNALFP